MPEFPRYNGVSVLAFFLRISAPPQHHFHRHHEELKGDKSKY